MKNIMFSEQRLIFRSGGGETLPPKVEKVPESVCKKADKRYFDIIKKAGKISSGVLQKRLERGVIPKQVKKAAEQEVNKTKFLYPTAKAYDAKVNKVARALFSKVKTEVKIQSSKLADVRGQIQTDIKKAAQKEAGYSETGSDDMTVSTGGRMATFKNIVSSMNGKVPKNKLLYVAKNYKQVAVNGVDNGVYEEYKVQIDLSIRRNMTDALNA